MKDIPIIFSGPMVLALLDGRKTMTRRLLPKRFRDARRCGEKYLHHWNVSGQVGGRIMLEADFLDLMPWKPGDRLWVRETFALDGLMDTGARYFATDNVHELRRKRSPIHMPRWASRLTLIVTATKIEPLQDISEDDAVAESMKPFGPHPGQDGPVGGAADAFMLLWRDLHGPGSWDANPYVVALTFTVHKQNIDAMPKSEAA